MGVSCSMHDMHPSNQISTIKIVKQHGLGARTWIDAHSAISSLCQLNVLLQGGDLQPP